MNHTDVFKRRLIALVENCYVTKSEAINHLKKVENSINNKIDFYNNGTEEQRKVFVNSLDYELFNTGFYQSINPFEDMEEKMFDGYDYVQLLKVSNVHPSYVEGYEAAFPEVTKLYEKWINGKSSKSFEMVRLDYLLSKKYYAQIKECYRHYSLMKLDRELK